MTILFGQYTQVHIEGNNTMNPRTVGAITLRPGGNRQKSVRFLSLHTGRVITGRSWTSIPVPQDFIRRVHRLARRSRANRNPHFTDREHRTIRDTDGGDGDVDRVYPSDVGSDDNVSSVDLVYFDAGSMSSGEEPPKLNQIINETPSNCRSVSWEKGVDHDDTATQQDEMATESDNRVV